MADPHRRLLDSCLALAWSLWGELGASTWERRHQQWAIELEPLIAFTACIGEHDRRLLREAIDWSAANTAFVSLSQYRHVTAVPLWDDGGSFARMGATMSSLTGRKWPGGGRGQAYEFQSSGKSRLRELSAPALFQLRLRAVFGLGTRAELVRVMLLNPSQEWSVAQIGERIAYTQRQAATDLQMLAKGGIVEKAERGPARYVLREASALGALVGPLPRFAPRWTPMFQALVALVRAVDAVGDGRLRQPDVEMARRLRHLEPLIAASGLPKPPSTGPNGIVQSTIQWATDIAARLADADPQVLPDSAMVAPAAGAVGGREGAGGSSRPLARVSTAGLERR